MQYILMTIFIAAVQAYGIVKPSKELPATGILHLTQQGEVELEGYFTKLQGQKPVTVTVWECDGSRGQPYCVGPQSNARLGTHFDYPVKQLYTLGQIIPDSTGYGELFLTLKGLTLSDLKKDNLKILVSQEGKSSLVDLRWIED